MKPIVTVVLVYAYDRMVPNGGTQKRIDKAIDFLTKYRQLTNWGFLFNAGFTKESPNYPTAKVKVSIAKQMYDYLKSKLPNTKNVPDNQRLVWGTMQETRGCVEGAERLKQRYNINEIVICTNWIHIPRVWLCWQFLNKGFKLRFITCHHPFGGPKEYFKEVAKLIVYLWKFILGDFN
jgi:hypothetical protein